ncbi:unnamed protein product [Rotaria socialis]|uniref:Uncharacterized protein n=1 Tax=Rotaria socialis TaxID=392032 RepID=A0A817KXG4_9BILA|nr:unnamed protein product [Rotaria socialis]CAF3347629.1 unnamed protein product [Rotaria socialis]CAF3510977.1 unnamed protein product [Rotaria socialis]
MVFVNEQTQPQSYHILRGEKDLLSDHLLLLAAAHAHKQSNLSKSTTSSRIPSSNSSSASSSSCSSSSSSTVSSLSSSSSSTSSTSLVTEELSRKVHRARSRTIPCIPGSLIFDIPDSFSFTSLGEKFIVFDHLYSNRTKKILAFASPLQLRKLFSSPLICLDGTFSIAPKCYKQLLIIQSIDAKNYEAYNSALRRRDQQNHIYLVINSIVDIRRNCSTDETFPYVKW